MDDKDIRSNDENEPLDIIKMNKILENDRITCRRVNKIMSLINIEGSNKVEINIIKELIKKYPRGFLP
jgi:hypothetical protein